MSATPAAPLSGFGADEVDRDRIDAEFDEWRRTLPRRLTNTAICPKPTEPDGLPPGWTLVGHMAQNEFVTIHLVRDAYSDWFVLAHTVDMQHTKMVAWSTRVTGLYEQSRTESTAGLRFLTDWLGREVAALYDSTVEVEAAARVVVALGGPAAIEPRAAQNPLHATP